MGLIAVENGKKFTPAPAGTHLAICCQVIDIGHQFSKYYNKVSHKALIGWELPDEKDEEDKPFLVWHRYTVSLGEKATLRLHLEAWRGRAFTEEERKGFHLKNVLGQPCMLNIGHEENDGNTYARVKAVMKIPKGTVVPKLTAKSFIFDLDDFDQAIFDTFSDNLKKTIQASEERSGKSAQPAAATSMAPAAGSSAIDDDIPF